MGLNFVKSLFLLHPNLSLKEIYVVLVQKLYLTLDLPIIELNLTDFVSLE